MITKEIIIANLKNTLSELNRVCDNISAIRNEITGLIAELEDDSKLGIPAEYDFGSGKIKEANRLISHQVKKNIKILNKIENFIDKTRKESENIVSAEMKEYEKE
jgi:hypothetical protein